jgi:UDP-N-acetylmuramoylalanine--D-glutamate ligase
MAAGEDNMKLADKHVVVVGLKRSGIAAVRFLLARGARVTATDLADLPALGAAVAELEALGARLELGRHDPDTLSSAELVILSPGVAHTIAPVQRAMQRGIPVWGELELAARFVTQPMVAVTGTNGKTTATTLIGEMLRQSGRRVFVGGNIGTPLIDLLQAEAEQHDVVVVEVSSFQLDTAVSFRPRVAVLLNITPDHLDRYPDMAAYARSKARIFACQQPQDAAIYFTGDPWVRRVVGDVAGRRLPFAHTADCPLGDGCGAEIAGDVVRCRIEAGETLQFRVSRLPGAHNRENAAAACLAALSAGGSAAGVQAALDGFAGLAHRLEYVATVNGVRFFDDSKATNVDAVARALEAFEEPVVLIMGGRNKGMRFEGLQPAVRRHVRRLVVLGEAADELAAALGPACPEGVERARTMAEAVAKALSAARPGQSVLLSPACASFDMFDSYVHRGEVFRAEVARLA